MATSPVHPSTSAPSPGDFAKAYEEVARETGEIVSIHITGKQSATYNAALLGKEIAEKKGCRVEVIDSKGVTMWQGLAAIAAAKAAEAGDNLEQAVSKVHETISQLRVLALLDTVTHVVKGGRLGKAAHGISTIESLLNIKLLLTLVDGEIRPDGLVRGRRKGVERLREFVRSVSSIEEVAVVYSTVPDEAQTLADYVYSVFPNIVPRIVRLGPALGVHGGPGALMIVVREAK